MKRDFLEALGIDKETIDKILDENSRDIGREKQKTEQLKSDKEAAEQQLADRVKDIEDLKKSTGDAAAIKAQLEELQEKYDKETEAYKAQLAERDYGEAINKAIADSGVKFTSKAAEKAFIAEIKTNKFEVKDGVLEGFNQFLEKAKTDDPSAFVKAGAKIDTQGTLEGGSVEKKPMTLAAALHEQYDK